MRILDFTYNRGGVGGTGYFQFVVELDPSARWDDCGVRQPVFVGTWQGKIENKAGSFHKEQHLHDQIYTFIRIDHAGPHPEEVWRTDNIWHEISAVMFKLHDAWMRKPARWEYSGGKNRRVGY